MVDGDCADVRFSANPHEVAVLRLYLKLLAVSHRNRHRKRLSFLVWQEIDSGDHVQRHFAVVGVLAIDHRRLALASCDEPGKFRILDDQLLTIFHSDNNFLSGRGGLKENSNNKARYRHHSLSTPSAMPMPPLMHRLASPSLL